MKLQVWALCCYWKGFQSFNSPIMRNFVLNFSFFFFSSLSVIKFCFQIMDSSLQFSKSMPLRHCVHLLILLCLVFTGNSWSWRFATILGLVLSLCLVFQVLQLSQTIIVWRGFFTLLYNFYCGTSLSSMLPTPFLKEKITLWGKKFFNIWR